jgi:hypothetical protein
MNEQEILEKTNPPANLGDFVTEGTGACRYNEAIKQRKTNGGNHYGIQD